MTPVIDASAAHNGLMAAYTSLRQHYKSDAYAAVVAWIDGLICAQQAYMATCGRDKLGDAQVRLKQLAAQRSALVDPGGATTGYQFD